MAGLKPRARIFAALTTAALGVATVVLVSGSAADAAVTCPTVGSGGVVTPAPAPGVDWQGCRLTGADLSGADLSGANLTSTSLGQANLSGANLTGTDLTTMSLAQADLSGANLTDATIDKVQFRYANLSSANFTGATMTGVYSGVITASPAPTLPADWLLTDGYLVGPGAVLDSAALSDANLASADLTGAELSEADLSGANLEGADFSNADLTAANLAGVDVDDADLTTADLDSVESGGITGTTTMLPLNWALRDGFLVGPNANLEGDNASGADFSGTNLDNASLYGTNLSGANLSDADLFGIDGAGVILQNADLTGANLSDASIALDAFGGGAPTLAGADLAGATLTGIITADIAGPPPAVLPAHWMLADGFLLGPTANLTDAETPFQGLDLEGMDLADANIASAEFVQDNLTNATFAGSNATAANFSGDTWSNTICPNGVSSTYYVSGCFTPRRYEMSLIIAPKPGSALSKSPSHFTAEFRLANPGVSVLTGSAAQALAADHDLRAILAGPGITTQVVNCGWNNSASYFTCTFATPALAQTGTSHNYTITVRVNQGSGFMSAMPISSVPNPETIHFS
jgi:trimeric autotransporter adhesin